jgi:hypothetical protein
MNTLGLLDQAMELAVRLGYTVRQDSFAGSGGGACVLNGRKMLFLDLDLGPAERLEQVAAALRAEFSAADLTSASPASLSPELRRVLELK